MTDRSDALEKQASPAQEELIFALDIGTRSVIGVVGKSHGELFQVLAIESMEHTKRAMVDGQIEDIEQVAKIAGAVKEKLEKRLDVRLTHVCVAAAGRSLKTQKATYETEVPERQPIKRNEVVEWELAAVEQAYESLIRTGNEAAVFSCVGYSVLHYHLDDYQISTLVDHKGKNIKIEVVATFLPNEVIESLYEVMSRIGLAVASLTLEPIAAMNAIIPQEIRMLNLALVDVGAGTSDIAISSGGSVTAYTMVTLAGDEVSEEIVQNFLVDFETAERIKQQLSEQTATITFQDIIGVEYELDADEVFNSIKACAQKLCAAIAAAIIEINGQAPAAVFLVGGGSRLVNMADMVAAQLDISPKKVAVGGSNYMKKMLEAEIDVSAAEYATPMGIAITAMNQMQMASVGIVVNGKPVNLFKNSSLSVMDVLLMSGYKQNQLIGRNGQSVTFELNTKRIIARGGHPLPAQIQVNGKLASLTTPVNTGDIVDVKPAVSGEDATPVVSQYVDDCISFPVTLNNEEKQAGRQVFLNGRIVDSNTAIHNLDMIEVMDVYTIEQLCRLEQIDTRRCRFVVNGRPEGTDYRLQPGDRIYYETGSDSHVREQFDETLSAQAENTEEEENFTEDTSTTEEVYTDSKTLLESMNQPALPNSGKGSPAPSLYVSLNGRPMTLTPKADGMPYLFFDMLNFVDIDPTKPQGNIILRINDRNAEYLEQLHDGDDIEIYWEGSTDSYF